MSGGNDRTTFNLSGNYNHNEGVFVGPNNYNDRGMLEFAGTGVAMGNSVAELLDGAFHVTGSNDEAGLAQAIGRFALTRTT